MDKLKNAADAAVLVTKMCKDKKLLKGKLMGYADSLLRSDAIKP